MQNGDTALGGFSIVTLGGVVETTATGVPIGFVQILTGDQNQPISSDNPLSVQEVFGASGKAPLLGNLAADGVSPTAFVPIPGRPFTVSGTYIAACDGVLTVMKSYDAGATLLPVFADGNPANAFQQTFSQTFMEPESGVSYYLQLTGRTVGNVSTRISQ